jgi:hypothetical protein
VKKLTMLLGICTVLLLMAGRNAAAESIGSGCPAVGNETGCALEIIVEGQTVSTLSTLTPHSPQSSLIFLNLNSTPMDATGADDYMIGVLNLSGHSIQGLSLFGPSVFAFDGDGMCGGYANQPSGCPFSTPADSGAGATYAGPGTSFSNFDSAGYSGRVNFIGGLANGGSSYFSLEQKPTGGSSATPEPASLVLIGTGLCISAVRKRFGKSAA